MRSSRVGVFLCAALVVCCVLSTASAQSKAPLVAVFDIEDKTGAMPRKALQQLTQYLTGRMAEGAAFQVIPSSQLSARLVQEKRKSYRACVDEKCQIEIGRELAAQKSLASQILKVGTRCAVVITLYDLKRAATERSATIRGGCSRDELVDALDRAVEKLKGIKQTPPKIAPPPPSGKRGGLLIKSQPSGAEVWLDQTKMKGTTPLTLSGLVAGEHQLVLSKGEFHYGGKVEVQPDRFTTVSLTLEKARGHLEVLSTPPEARILLDGREVGQTPKMLIGIEAGSHTITLHKDGYLSTRRTIEVAPGASKHTERITLQQAGRLAAHSTPSGASVFVDGNRAGTSPTTAELAPGPHTIRMEMMNRVTVSRQVVVKAGELANLSVTLDFTPAEKQRQAQAEARRREEVARLAAAEQRFQAAVALHGEKVARSRKTTSIWAYTTLGASAALAGTAAVLYVLGAIQGADAHESYSYSEDPEAQQRYADDVSAARTKLVVGHVLTGTAVAALVASLYLFKVRARVPEGPKREEFGALRDEAAEFRSSRPSGALRDEAAEFLSALRLDVCGNSVAVSGRF